MSEEVDLKELTTAMKKSKEEFDIATSLIANALKDVHERLERIETCITESQAKTQE